MSSGSRNNRGDSSSGSGSRNNRGGSGSGGGSRNNRGGSGSSSSGGSSGGSSGYLQIRQLEGCWVGRAIWPDEAVAHKLRGGGGGSRGRGRGGGELVRNVVVRRSGRHAG